MGMVESQYLVVSLTYPASTQFNILVRLLDTCLVKYPSRFQARSLGKFRDNTQDNTQDSSRDNTQGNFQDNYL